MGNFFVRRPIVAMVIAIVLVIVGVVSLISLPMEQYPDITPPVVEVKANYTGANAISVEQSVATPIEQEMNGVENMIYMKSINSNDGVMRTQISFEVGSDPDMNTVFAQNRVSAATAKLPEDVKRLGVTTKKTLPNTVIDFEYDANGDAMSDGGDGSTAYESIVPDTFGTGPYYAGYFTFNENDNGDFKILNSTSDSTTGALEPLGTPNYMYEYECENGYGLKTSTTNNATNSCPLHNILYNSHIENNTNKGIFVESGSSLEWIINDTGFVANNDITSVENITVEDGSVVTTIYPTSAGMRSAGGDPQLRAQTFTATKTGMLNLVGMHVGCLNPANYSMALRSVNQTTEQPLLNILYSDTYYCSNSYSLKTINIADPIFIKEGIIHYCVPNILAAVARTASRALNNVVLPYIMKIGEGGLKKAFETNAELQKGVITHNGYCTNKSIADIFNLPYQKLEI